MAAQLKLKSFSGASGTLFLNRTSPADYGTVDRIQIGDFVALNHRVYYADRKEDDFPISLGMDIFQGYAVLLDFAQKKMYLGRLKAAKTQPVSDKSSK